jgi:hypothetical protein
VLYTLKKSNRLQAEARERVYWTFKWIISNRIKKVKVR